MKTVTTVQIAYSESKGGEKTEMETAREVKRYWEKGDLLFLRHFESVLEVTKDSDWLNREVGKDKLDRIPTQEEINNYRLEKCKKDYPAGSRFKSAFTGSLCTIEKGYWEVSDNNIVNQGKIIYLSVGDTYAEIVEQSPLEKLKEYASQQYPDDTILRDRINNLNQ